MKIALDLDGVVYQFDKTAQYMLALHAGHDVREALDWDHAQYWRGVDRKHWAWLWSPEQSDALYRHGHLFRGAIEFVNDLSRLGDVTAVTTRPKYTAGVTRDWLDFHWPKLRLPLLITRDKDEAQADVLIDDFEKNLVAAKAHATFGILVDRPWNQAETHYDVRAFSYAEVLDTVRDGAHG